VSQYEFTGYFENEVLRKRPYLQRAWCIHAIEHPIHVEVQSDDSRVRFWTQISEMDNRFLRVVTLGDRVTIHNAFFDRRFKP
jgi:hypothetical protein